MPDLTRLEVAHEADPLVVKVGTRCLTNSDGTLDESQIESISRQLAAIGAGHDRRVVLVSSGAVGAGIGLLKLPQRPTDLPTLQAAAAIGQCHVIEAYNRALQEHGLLAGQVLLTADDINDRQRYLNARNAIRAMFEHGVVPIVNENDTVRTDELAKTMGDNDQLAAMVANLIGARLLVILTDVEGLYDGHPDDKDSSVIETVEELGETQQFVHKGQAGEGPSLSTGGMASKLRAASLASRAGESVVLANGRRKDVLIDLMDGEVLGTLIPGSGERVGERKRWIGFATMPQGSIELDAGAVHAVEVDGKSLLPVGISRVIGEFESGDPVSLVDQKGAEVARGLTNYNSADLREISGQPTESIAGILGRSPHPTVVHRNNLALVRSSTAG